MSDIAPARSLDTVLVVIRLRERDEPAGAAPALIEQTVRFALNHGYHVILQGILHAARHRHVLELLRAGHRGRTLFVYLNVPLDETLRRHATRSQSTQFTADDMRGWYVHHDFVGLQRRADPARTTSLDEATVWWRNCRAPPRGTRLRHPSRMSAAEYDRLRGGRAEFDIR